MIRSFRSSCCLSAGVLALSLDVSAAPAGDLCGVEGRILDRADLLARLGSNAVIEGFEAFQLPPDNVDCIAIQCLDATTIADGQGPGLVQPGARYCNPLVGSDWICWNGDQYYQRTTKTIEAYPGGAIHILYTRFVTAMGVDLSAFIGYGYSGTATLYDTADHLLGTVEFTLATGGPERFFVGWYHAGGIGRVEIASPTWSWSPKIDDHAYGACGSVGDTFCLGNGSLAPCPCGNQGTYGCENSASTGGAVLGASGNASVASDTVVLTSAGELPSALTIFLSGPIEIPPTNFGDGLRCTGGQLRRLYVKNAVNGIARAPTLGDPSITARMAALGAPLHAGESHHYQAYYRDPVEGFCPAQRFNISSGVRIQWSP